jgi:putative ABC transport system permease protein
VSTLQTREHRSSVLVAALGSGFGVLLIQSATTLATIVEANDIGSFAAVKTVLEVTAIIFTLIAVYVSAVVTLNTVATVVAGRTRVIALMRLVGATSAQLRRTTTAEGALAGVVGAVIGGVLGLGVVFGATGIAVASGALPALNYWVVDPTIALPVVMVVISSWLATLVGSRAVLSVSPIEATGAVSAGAPPRPARRPVRTVLCILLLSGGALLLALGVLVGTQSPAGALIAVPGALLSFSGVLLAAGWFMPASLAATGRLFGRSAPARLAAANATRHPERSTRMTVGLMIGVTLVTSFSVAIQGFENTVSGPAGAQPGNGDVQQILSIVTVILSCLIGFSGVIAAVGLVNNLSLGVLQRRREIGLLRALGFTVRQIRSMIVFEAAQLTITAVVVGLALGTLYGWVGAQSLIGSVAHGLTAPGVPVVQLIVIVVAAVALTALASIIPTRLAARLSVTDALAVVA